MDSVQHSPEFLTAFEASSFLHEVFYGGLQNADEATRRQLLVTFRNLGIAPSVVNPNETEKMVIDGHQNGIPVSETLSRDARGNFHFSILYTWEGGPLINHTFTPEGEQSSDPDVLELVKRSLFMQAFHRLGKAPKQKAPRPVVG